MRIPFLAIAVAVCIVLSVTTLVIGGLFAGWDIWGILTSQSALLIYLVLFLIIVFLAFKYFCSKDTR